MAKGGNERWGNGWGTFAVELVPPSPAAVINLSFSFLPTVSYLLCLSTSLLPSTRSDSSAEVLLLVVMQHLAVLEEAYFDYWELDHNLLVRHPAFILQHIMLRSTLWLAAYSQRLHFN